MTVAYKLFTSTDPVELVSRQDLAFERFADLAGSVDPGLRLNGSAWTTRDLVGHVLTVMRRYTRRDPNSTDGLGDSPREVDRLNDEELAALGSRNRDELLVDLGEEMTLLRELYQLDGLELEDQYPFHGGVKVDAAAGMSNVIGEFLIHGRDLALAAARPWAIDERDAVLILNGVLQILPAYAEPNVPETLTLKLNVPNAEPWLLAFDRGSLESRPARDGDAVDAVVRAPAVTLMLALYSRLSPVSATRRGMFVVGGRRPWRVTRLSRLIQQP